MPLFDVKCTVCFYEEEDVLAASPPEVCGECGGKLHVPPAMFAPSGIIYSNVNRSDQLGAQIESNAQQRAFEKANPNVFGFAKGSSDDIRIGDKIRNRAEKVAKKQGFRDHEDKITTLKKQKAERVLTTPAASK